MLTKRQARLFSTYVQRWLHLQGVSCKSARGLAFPRLVPEAVRVDGHLVIRRPRVCRWPSPCLKTGITRAKTCAKPCTSPVPRCIALWLCRTDGMCAMLLSSRGAGRKKAMGRHDTREVEGGSVRRRHHPYHRTAPARRTGHLLGAPTRIWIRGKPPRGHPSRTAV